MSIQSNGSFLYGTNFNDSDPNPDAGTWTALLAMRIALPPLSFGLLFQAQTDDGFGGAIQYQFRFNTFENYEIRTPTPDDGTIPVVGPHAVDTNPPGVWAWFGYRCQVTNPAVDWSGTLEWFYIVDGETTLQVVRTLAVLDCRLAAQYLAEFLLPLNMAGLSVELESFRVWGRVLSDAELVAQSRTFTSLYTTDHLHYAPFLDVATLAPSGTNGGEYGGAAIDGATRPSYPDDPPPTPTVDLRSLDMTEIRAPYDKTTPNDFGAVKFTVTATVAKDVIPASLRGCLVQIVSSVDAEFAFSEHSNAEVDFAVVATAPGVSLKVGGKLFAGIPVLCRVPFGSAALYFVRDAGGAGTIHMQKASESSPW